MNRAEQDIEARARAAATSEPPDATVLITTKNRKGDLRKAVASARAQTGATVEVIVVDDGSTDGTAEMIRSEFPSVRLERSRSSLGYIEQRNRGIRLARAPVVITIDDDAEFSAPDIVSATLAQFDDPRIGAVAIPHVNVREDERPLGRATDERPHCVHWFIGTAQAVRRDLFLALGGYRTELGHIGEEPEYCLRLLEAGYVTRIGRSEEIRHYESKQRDHSRNLTMAVRNELLLVFLLAPTRRVPGRLLGATVLAVKWAVRSGETAPLLKGLAQGWVDGLRHLKLRRPISVQTYDLNRRLQSRGPIPLDEVRQELNPVAGPASVDESGRH